MSVVEHVTHDWSPLAKRAPGRSGVVDDGDVELLVPAGDFPDETNGPHERLVSLSVDAWISARPSSAERRLKARARPESCGQLSIAEHRPRASAGTVARGGLVGGRARGDYCRRLWIPRSPFWVAGTTPFWWRAAARGILRLGESPRGEPLRCHLSLDGRLCLGGRRWLGFIRSSRFVSSQAAPARARLIEAIIAQPT